MMPLKIWYQRRQKHYQQAIDEYLVRLKSAFKKDLEGRAKRLESRSIIIDFGCGQQTEGDEDAQEANKQLIQGLSVARESLLDPRLGEEILLIDPESSGKRAAAKARGQIVEVGDECVKIKLCQQIDSNTTKKFRLAFSDRELLERIERVEYAMHRFKQASCSSVIQKCLLGYYNDWSNVRYGRARVLEHEALTVPKGYQQLAIEQAMKKRITLIEGVAGSGKTLIAANLACSMSNLRKRKILLCSPIQATVDRLAQMINRVDTVMVVQMAASDGRELGSHKSAGYNYTNCYAVDESSSIALDCNLDSLVDEAIYKRSWDRSLRSAGRLPYKFHQQATRAVLNCSPFMREKIKQEILAKADIVCCTLLQAGTKCLRSIKFDVLIVDDAHLASEAECLVALMAKGLGQLALLSDMRQEIRLARASLPIVVSSANKTSAANRRPTTATGVKLAESRSLGGSLRRRKSGRTRASSMSNHQLDRQRLVASRQAKRRELLAPGGLFERLVSLGLSTVALKRQYRMHETLAAFSKHHFYMSRLKTDPQMNEQLGRRIHDNVLLGEDSFNWLPNKHCLTAVFDASDADIENVAKDIVYKLTKRENIDEIRLGVITNVQPSSKLQCDLGKAIQLGTIENFFGEEKDFIVLACHNQPSNDRLCRSAKVASSGQIDDTSADLFALDCNYSHNNTALNIALTRARLGLFIVTDLSSIIEPGESQLKVGHCRSWLDLIKYYQVNKLVS